jgi:hypothetical protein
MHTLALSSSTVASRSRIGGNASFASSESFFLCLLASLSLASASIRSSSPRIAERASYSAEGPASSIDPSSLYDRNGRYISTAPAHPIVSRSDLFEP